MTIEYNDSQKVNQMIPLRTTDEKRWKIMTDLPRYMKLGQALKYLNIGSYNTLYKYIDQGLKVSIVGGVKRIDQVDCDKFLESKKI